MIDLVEAVLDRPVPRETREQLEHYVDLLRDEAERQNLIARSTVPDIWSRHIADSAQLVPFAEEGRSWVDIGSGAGLPGMVVAILTGDPVTLVEPRRLRAEFLARVVEALAIENATVVAAKAEAVRGRFDLVTARAVAPALDLLRISAHLTHSGSKYLLMKGRAAQTELEAVRGAWQGDIRLVASRTDADAAILVAEHLRRKG